MAKQKYTGDLAMPIPKRIASLRGGLRNDTFTYEYMRRVHLLLDHYRIPPDSPNCWFDLALKLAEEHVPGLRVSRAGRTLKMTPNDRLRKMIEAPKRGRPRTVTDQSDDFLVYAVDREKSNHSKKADGEDVRPPAKTDKEALLRLEARHLKKKGKRESLANKHVSFLQKRLSRARKRLAVRSGRTPPQK
jgi:hypothetical protein